MDLRAVASAILVSLAAAGPASGGDAPRLENPGFEGSYRAVNPTGDTMSSGARIVGALAPGWQDNSGWADVGID